MPGRAFPLSPGSTRDLEVGDFWAVALADGTFGACQVTDLKRAGIGARTTLVAGVLDWSGAEPPTTETLSGVALLAQGLVGVEVFTKGGATIIGNAPLVEGGQEWPSPFRDFAVGTVTQTWGWKSLPGRVASTLARP